MTHPQSNTQSAIHSQKSELTHSLHALVLKLRALGSGTIPGTVGELAHAAFYATIQAVEPALAQAMHDRQNRKSFSLSPLTGYQQSARNQRTHVGQGQEGWLRICLLSPHLFAAFTRHLLTRSRPTLRLGPVRFSVDEVLGSPGSHPWAGYTTLEQLNRLDESPRQWTLDFHSPTAIRWGKADDGTRRIEIFPLPRMAVAGLRTRWDNLTGQEWGRDFEEWVERNVVVNRVWRWQTQPVRYKRQIYVGGQGKLSYRVLDTSDPEPIAHLNRLLHLAFYTGIGYKTTHGLGQVRISPKS